MRLRSGRWMRRGLVIGAATALAAALVPGTPAWASPACGDVLTSNTTLAANLSCAGDGFIIGADGITLNLGGHTLSGAGGGNGIADGFAGHFNNVTIRNGKVSGFGIDVNLLSVHDTTLRGVKLASAAYGLRGSAVPNTSFVSGSVTDANIRISDSPTAVITHSKLTNAPVSLDSSSNHSTLDHNTVTGSQVDLFEDDFTLVADNVFTQSSVGSFGSSRNGTFRDNRFEGSNVALDMFDNMLGTTVAFNTFRGNAIGLRMNGTPLAFLNGIRVSDNTFSDNGAAGALIESRDAVGLPVTATVADNRFTDNGLAPGGLTDRFGAPLADGLHIAVPAGGTVLVGFNATKHNGAYGIYAVPGTVTDAGGNTSVANPSGCLGVVC